MKPVLAWFFLALLVACGGGNKDVRINVALPPKLDLTSYDYVYFPGFITEIEAENIDTEREAVNFLKREFLRRDAIAIINTNLVDMSEKDPRSFFLEEQPFFKSFNFEHSELTLALTGVISFESVDRSGFQEVEGTDVYGRRRARTQYVEITGFNLNMRVYVYELNGGKLLYSETVQDTTDIQGSNPDERLVLYDLMQRVSDRVLGLFANTTVKAERTLL